MKIKEFSNISLKGRAAFSICCLENALLFFNLNKAGWKILLEKLWTVTELPEDINDIWIEIIVPILPNDFNEIHEYNEMFGNIIHLEEGKMVVRDEPHITLEEFNLLKEAYAESNNGLNNLIDEVYEVGSSYMNAGISKDGPFCYPSIKNIILFLESNKIELPYINLFKQYVFDPKQNHECYGWGIPFDGKKISRILN
jgi:hypothetical protein